MDDTAKEMSDSYLRIRAKLQWYGSYSTLLGGPDRFIKTEAALDSLLQYTHDMEAKLTKIEDIVNG